MKPDKTGGFTPRQVRAALLMAGGMSITRVAKTVKVSQSTIYSWLESQDFRRLISEKQTRLHAQAVGILVRTATKAALAMVECLRSSNLSIKLGAARSILDAVIAHRDHQEFDERLSVLEAKSGVGRNGVGQTRKT
jgi:hypothetical protein